MSSYLANQVIPGQQPYMDLSHCWGEHQIIPTMKDTIRERQTGIPWANLSRTFQDAIQVTRGLGFRYIWIDS